MEPTSEPGMFAFDLINFILIHVYHHHHYRVNWKLWHRSKCRTNQWAKHVCFCHYLSISFQTHLWSFSFYHHCHYHHHYRANWRLWHSGTHKPARHDCFLNSIYQHHVSLFSLNYLCAFPSFRILGQWRYRAYLALFTTIWNIPYYPYLRSWIKRCPPGLVTWRGGSIRGELCPHVWIWQPSRRYKCHLWTKNLFMMMCAHMWFYIPTKLVLRDNGRFIWDKFKQAPNICWQKEKIVIRKMENDACLSISLLKAQPRTIEF